MGVFSRLKGNVLFLPGSLSTHKAKGIRENYEKILEKMDIDFITLDEHTTSAGWVALHFGLREELENLKEKNNEIFRKFNVKKIITNDPHTYYVLKKEYNINVEHITETILRNMDKFNRNYEQEISYHDPCHLGRKSGIYHQPREILRNLGFKVVELVESGKNSLCCGQPLNWHAPKIANGIGRLRMSEVNTKRLITTCPACATHLKKLRPDVEVLELSEVLI